MDAAGPQALSFEELIRTIRDATGSRSPILHVPAPAFHAAARALGLLVKDVVLTSEEITALTSGLLISRQPSQARIAFSDWVAEHELGQVYANELNRHFAPRALRVSS